MAERQSKATDREGLIASYANMAASTPPAPAFPRDEVAAIVARSYGGSLCPGMGTPGDYPVDDVDYRAADAIAALLQGKQP